MFKRKLKFKDLAASWKSLHYLEIQESSAEQYERLLPALNPIANMAVAKIKSDTIDRLIALWRHESFPKSAIRQSYRKELALLQQLLHHYRRRHDSEYHVPIYAEHFKAAVVPGVAKRVKGALSDEELRRFFLSLKYGRAPKYALISMVQFSLALRIGECLGLLWDAINWEEKTATISRNLVWNASGGWTLKNRTKTGAVKVVHIPEFVFLELEKLKKENSGRSDFIFHENGEPFLRRNVYNAYNSAFKRIGAKIRGTHTMRRCSATKALKETKDIYLVKKMLSHSSVSTTEKYLDSEHSGSLLPIANALNSNMDLG